MRYGWPGNVRQLAGVLFRAALQCDGSSLTAEHFPHIAVQSRFTGRRTDFAATLSQVRSEQAIAGAPGVTLYSATVICARSRRSRPTSFAWRSAIIAAA